jgi:DNA-binding response OmpR family regulator
MSSKRILVVEDDPAIRRGIVDALELDGYSTVACDRGDRGLAVALAEAFDLLLLDLILPGMNGLDVLCTLRNDKPALPIIILTACGEEADRVRGLRAGADDYVVKPFSVRELSARVEAVLRRAPEASEETIHLPVVGGYADVGRQEILFDDGHRVELSCREVEILQYLARHRDRAISRDELMRRVWQIDPRGIQSRTIDMHIARLREKLRDNDPAPRVILTVRGKGYMYTVPEGAS